MTTAGSDLVLERLSRLHPKSIDLDLTRMERLLAALGHPEERLPPVVHVAGTNGKGSVVAFARAMLEAAGERVHVYTSPHLVRFHERIRVAGALIEESRLAAILDECEAANAGAPITFFEITTAAAFLAFSRSRAGALVLEVGLGGRLDATNVVSRPAVTAITPVGIDHESYLGTSLPQIAREKAGILKAGVPAIIGPQEPAALAVIEEVADRLGAPLAIFGQDFSAHEEHGRMVFQDTNGLLDLPLPSLVGRHQIANAAIAIAALRAAERLAVSEEAIEAGVTQAHWPARLQRLTRGPVIENAPEEAEIWLDGGHNPHAAAALAAALGEMEERRPRPLYLIVGMLAQKDAAGFLAHFRGIARHALTVTIEREPNAMGAGALYDAARRVGLPSDPAESLEDALAQIEARAALDRDGTPPRILICGSLMLAGRVLSENE
ncbi:MAG: bifunctional folylpolyglutamate synthase/dihydrofolate synthase [Alphaproteobacteria bacterium]|nr:bifunctional folylpolyglutamate synthase/dihydrofolate synthase [Alphaproteobacteria bacterium]